MLGRHRITGEPPFWRQVLHFYAYNRAKDYGRWRSLRIAVEWARM